MTPTNLYLTLMRKRFNMLNDPEVDPVPWELDDKDTAYAYVERAGYRVPRYVRTSSPAEALEAGIAMGDRFVIKQPNRHSTMGIYILEKLSNGKFLELFSLKELEAKDVVAVGPEPDYWLTEECIESQVAGRPLPFDYKVYAFRGKISHVVQIDRNVYPPRIAVFDGAFIPMKPEVDYWTDPDRWLHENHVMPVHAGAILEMASTLSKGLDTRFVRVDCFDGPDGPVFGEFTFASGPDDVGMLIYKSEIFEALDAAIDGADIPAFSGFDIDLDRFYSDLTKESTFEGPREVLSRLASGGVQGDSRYVPSMARYLRSGKLKHTFALGLNLIGHLNGDGSRAFGIQVALRAKAGHVSAQSRLDEFSDEALAFHDARAATGNPWHTSRAAEVRLASGDTSALDVLRSLAAGGYLHAGRVVASYEVAQLAKRTVDGGASTTAQRHVV